MGNCCVTFPFRRTSSDINPKKVTLLIVGLDKSGKTTIAKRLAGEPIDSVVPTVGFSVVNLRQKGCRVSLYDLGGGSQIRDIWHRYYADAHGVIFVVDAVATERLDECRQVLQNLLENSQISGKPVLLLANKQDLEGALDEIDIVERLNLEKIVNEQKCPTLVELCSALHFSKKLDIGIDNGYKWLIRGIIRDYPSLNNRVLRDLAKQEDENRVQYIKKVQSEEKIVNYVDENHFENPFKPVKEILENKSQMNGRIVNSENYFENTLTSANTVEEDQRKKHKKRKIRTERFSREGSVSIAESRTNSYVSDFFLSEKFQSDVELLNDVPNQSFKNFLVRPKSSGARLYGIRPEKKKTPRRKPLLKNNKTGPCPFADLANDQKAQMCNSFSPAKQKSSENISFPLIEGSGNKKRIRSAKLFAENANPFVVVNHVRDRRKSDQELKPLKQFEFEMKPISNFRQSLESQENASAQRNSTFNLKMAGGFLRTEKIPPLKVNNRLNNTKEILLDVMQLRN